MVVRAQCWWGRLVLKHGIAADYLIAFRPFDPGAPQGIHPVSARLVISSGAAIFVSVRPPCAALPLLVLAHWRVNGAPDPNVRRPGLV
jgi:hypothetical protein